MQPISKDGTPTYPHIFRKIQAVGAALEQRGYVERGRRPNLFVRDYGAVKFYADLGGTPEVPVWTNQSALFYWFWHPRPGPQPEVRERTVLVEWVRMRGVPLRLSQALAHDEAETRQDARLAEQYEYEDRRALFIGEHASWGDARFPSEVGRAQAEQAELLDDRARGHVRNPDVAALGSDPASALRVPGATQRRRQFIPPRLVRGMPEPARLRAVFASDRQEAEVLAYYADALESLGWKDAPFRPREQPRRDPSDPWAHDSGGRQWTRDGWTFRIFLLGGQDRIIYDLTTAPSAFETWLDGPMLSIDRFDQMANRPPRE